MSDKQITLLGVNHKTTPVGIREKLAVTDDYQRALADLQGVPGIVESYLLSTCNRVELVCVCEGGDEIEQRLRHFLFKSSVSPEKWDLYSYLMHEEDAIRHLFQVASSLDSMVLGEAQILGQIKEAYRYATDKQATGPLLNRLLHKSFSVAKRVRTETGIGSSAVSISSAAVELARKIFGDLTDKEVLLIGAGEMAELAAEHLIGQGVKRVSVANRTLSRAVELAKRFQGKAHSLEELTSEMQNFDIIISSTGASELVITGEQVKGVMKIRRNRPLFFIDIAVPRDIDPKLNDIDDVFLYDIDDLSQIVDVNRAEREQEAVKAQRIVDEETLKFSQWRKSLTVTPTITALRQKANEICEQEVARTLAKLDLNKKDRQKVEKLASAVAAKLLHHPLHYLKSEACREGEAMKVDMVKTLFGLEEE